MLGIVTVALAACQTAPRGNEATPDYVRFSGLGSDFEVQRRVITPDEDEDEDEAA